MTETDLEPSPIPEIGRLTLHEIWASLRAGAYDFRRAPAFGLFFSGFYVLVGVGLILVDAGTFVWTLVLSLGFPLVAPFAAVGLYDVSRRLEADEPLVWSEILGVVIREKDRQIPWMGAIILIVFLFWSFFAHMLFALFMGLSTLTNISTSYEALLTPTGLTMMGLQVVVGAAVAFLVFSATVVSLPLLLEKEIDFVSAMLISFKTVEQNFPVMLTWAAVIAVALFLGMMPVFLGLLLALPILGHATWHIYRRVLYHPL
ncbi:MAG: DUF2189 domain-containing protein [Rhodobacteraceae bacterium]|nr:DUF2189 domain-containing protein [Paracoccaceae bacterium]